MLIFFIILLCCLPLFSLTHLKNFSICFGVTSLINGGFFHMPVLNALSLKVYYNGLNKSVLDHEQFIRVTSQKECIKIFFYMFHHHRKKMAPKIDSAPFTPKLVQLNMVLISFLNLRNQKARNIKLSEICFEQDKGKLAYFFFFHKRFAVSVDNFLNLWPRCEWGIRV